MKYLLFTFLLTACGSECIQVKATTRELSFGTLEEVKCPEGEYVKSVFPKYLPGGEVVTHLMVTCERVYCEGVNQ